MKHFHFNTLGSTNDTAKELLHRGDTPDCFAVTADEQTNGRGRNGKIWETQARDNVLCSIALRHRAEVSLESLVAYQAIGCLAAQAALREVCRLQAPTLSFALKYPNDIYTGAPLLPQPKKICGVLVEHDFIGSLCTSSIIGIGINVRQKHFSPELERTATSLLRLGIHVQVRDGIAALLRYIEFGLRQNSTAIMTAWQEELALEGKIVWLHDSSERWRIVSMLPDGRLQAMGLSTGSERVIDNGDSFLDYWQL